MSFAKKSLPLLAVAATLLTANAAMAMKYGHDYARYNRDNCLFKSSVAHKGGENTRTGWYDTTDTDQKKYCTPNATKWRGIHADTYYKDGTYKERTRVDANGRVVRY